MKQLFLAPRSSETAYENFKSSLAEGRPLGEILPYLTDKQKEIVKNQDVLYVWGAQKSKEDTWQKMEIGDYVLFYSHYAYIQAGEIQMALISEDLALKLWPRDKETHEAWSCLYFIKNLRNINIPIKDFNYAAGYDMEYLRGLQRVEEKHLYKILASYGNLDNFIENITIGLKDYQVGELNKISQKEPEKIGSAELESIDNIFGERDPDEVLAELSARNLDRAPEERQLQSIRIVRDYKLVRAIKEKYHNRCQVQTCQFTFKMSNGGFYSEAAHIKAISTRAIGVDVAENILVLCPNHHKMLDYGAMEILPNKKVKIEGEDVNLT